MLYEISHVRQSRRSQHKRWFTCTDIDLFIWFHDNMPVRFQLYFDKSENERVICWQISSGFSCYEVYKGESLPTSYTRWPLSKTTFAAMDRAVTARNFLACSGDIDTSISDFIYGRLMSIPPTPVIGGKNRADRHLAG